jgi:hypothetical protein
MRTECPHCKKQFNAPDQALNQRVKCASCGEPFRVEAVQRTQIGSNEESSNKVDDPAPQPQSKIAAGSNTMPINKMKKQKGNKKSSKSSSFPLRPALGCCALLFILIGGYFVFAKHFKKDDNKFRLIAAAKQPTELVQTNLPVANPSETKSSSKTPANVDVGKAPAKRADTRPKMTSNPSSIDKLPPRKRRQSMPPTLNIDLVEYDQLNEPGYLIEPYEEFRKRFKSNIIKKDAVPLLKPLTETPVGYELVEYSSDGQKLKGYISKPIEVTTKLPAIVFIHNGFGIGLEGFKQAEPFYKQNFIVFFPTFRGENGNPGNFEMLYGEVDDAANAVRWLATQPDVDTANIFAFGYNSGGSIAGLLTLRSLPLKHTASAEGFYSSFMFDDWAPIAPFDISIPDERKARLLYPFASDIKTKHYIYDYLAPEDPNDRFDRARLVQMQPVSQFASQRKQTNPKITIITEYRRPGLPKAEELYLKLCLKKDGEVINKKP